MLSTIEANKTIIINEEIIENIRRTVNHSILFMH